MASSSETVQRTNQIVGRRRWWALATVMLTMFFSSMDQTVVSTAIPTIVSKLNGLNLYSWLFSAYMMASAVTVPIYGKLSDVFGRKPFYIFGLVMFGVGSAISGLSHTMLELVIARGIQGIGAGAMMSMPRATIGDIFDPKERGRWMGVIGAVFGLSSIIGPALGGWITDSLSWRWVFYINLPFAVLALIGVIVTLPRVRAEHRVQVDWFGALLMIIGLIPILLGFTWAGTKYAWGSSQIILLFVVGVVLLVLFLLWERRAKEPVLTPTLFKSRIFTMSLILGIFMMMGMFGSMMYLPTYVQGVIGLNATNSGFLLSPMMISFIVASVISGQIMTRTGRYVRLANVSSAIIIVGFILLATLNVNTHFWSVIIYMVVLGLGIGALMPLLNVAVQNAFPYEMMGTVNSTQQFVSSLGGVIASPIFGSVLNNGFQHKLNETMPAQLNAMKSTLSSLDPQALLTAQAQHALKSKFASMGSAGQTLYNQLIHAVKVSLTTGVHHLFLVGLIFGCLTFIGTFFLPEVRLKGKEYFASSDRASGDAPIGQKPQVE
ncbi:MFS transporter [Alicyclobacillus fastidiosus]|uniref:MFS transporter n=1 Tax=Alicyclobacillus fastidiosus TaxID=392011 RepID=A0ABY6ZMI4_9BACL|nr:MDR family MFS transporter [Alicyclobacillus fastidiosus]WAH43331.1 MFS transporter [Alicyclobacillus fastidiosus]GMA65388.1 MFS transporter [Alicyclobacillus fastidiosus]